MSSGFITETEIVEARKKRQEEWEKVRNADDPVVKPEEPYEHRSLYERLQEQKQKKDLEYEEAHKLKNMIKGLDDDEIEFLDLIDRTKLAADRKKEIEEELELNDYRNRVATLHEKSLDQRLQVDVASNKAKAVTNKKSQQKLLKGIVVKKTDNPKRKCSDSSNDEEVKVLKKLKDGNELIENCNKKNSIDGESSTKSIETSYQSNAISSSGLTCVGILPGLGCYTESTSDENSSDSEIECTSSSTLKMDMLGRKIVNKAKEES